MKTPVNNLREIYLSSLYLRLRVRGLRTKSSSVYSGLSMLEFDAVGFTETRLHDLIIFPAGI